MSTDEVCQMAQNLARNCGYAVFPIGHAKTPTTPNGFLDSETDPEAIERLWRKHPGPHVGVATGARSGISILDVDSGNWAPDEKPAIILKHEAARFWWHQNFHKIPVTRINGTRSGGLHAVFRHRPGVGVSQSRIHQGIDTRGDGGYAVWWFCAGYPCHRNDPPADWPDWLFEPLVAKPPPPKTASSTPTGTFKPDAERVIQTAKRWVTNASEGTKHERLRQAARLIGGIADVASISEKYAVSFLVDCLPDTAKDLKQAEKTVIWGFTKGKAEPLQPRARP